MQHFNLHRKASNDNPYSRKTAPSPENSSRKRQSRSGSLPWTQQNTTTITHYLPNLKTVNTASIYTGRKSLRFSYNTTRPATQTTRTATAENRKGPTQILLSSQPHHREKTYAPSPQQKLKSMALHKQAISRSQDHS